MSSSSSKYLSIFRMVVFSKTILCSVIVISLSANLISLTDLNLDLNLAPFALVTALLSKLTVVTMFVVDIRRQGSIFSYIVVEIVGLSVLWVLWLSTGSYAAWTDGQLTAAFPNESNCDFVLFPFFNAIQICHEIKAIIAFSFLTWILLMSYTIVLVVLAIRAKERGNSAWTTGVRDGVLFYPVRKTTGGAAQVQTALATIPYSLPPPQQHLPPRPPPPQPYPPYPSSYPIPQV